MRRRLLILGTGFGARHLLHHIDLRRYDVTVISPRNHFLFTPLLPSTTVGTVEFRTIIESIRSIRRGVQYFQAAAISVDPDRRVVRCQGRDERTEWDQPYDLLILAVGCVTNTFGVPGVEEYGFVLKELADARRIRERVIQNLERASLPGISDEERSRLMHFVAVGGGPTGVRFAAELHDLLSKDLAASYPHLRDHVRVTVVDANKSLLTAYDEQLRNYVQQVFQRRGVQFEPGNHVRRVGATHVELDGGRLVPCGMVLWAAGFARNPLIDSLPWEKDRAGRLLLADTLQVEGAPDVYALGDCATPRSGPLPQLAQVAAQQGRYLAHSLNELAAGKPIAPFRWKNQGVSSYVGAGAAVAESENHAHPSAGSWAYQQWRVTLWSDLLSWKSRLMIPLDRLRAALFGRDLSRF
jgi:NADH:ubiquinone reductase (non-electrogenic)